MVTQDNQLPDRCYHHYCSYFSLRGLGCLDIVNNVALDGLANPIRHRHHSQGSMGSLIRWRVWAPLYPDVDVYVRITPTSTYRLRQAVLESGISMNLSGAWACHFMHHVRSDGDVLLIGRSIAYMDGRHAGLGQGRHTRATWAGLGTGLMTARAEI
jgi:hypothetical protein